MTYLPFTGLIGWGKVLNGYNKDKLRFKEKCYHHIVFGGINKCLSSSSN